MSIEDDVQAMMRASHDQPRPRGTDLFREPPDGEELQVLQIRLVDGSRITFWRRLGDGPWAILEDDRWLDEEDEGDA